MKNRGIMALVMSLLVLVALVWNPPAATIEKEGGGSYSEVATVFNVSGSRIKPASATESFTNSVTLTSGMPVTERSNPHPGGYLSIGILNKILKILQNLINSVLAFLGNSLSLSINQSSTKEGSTSPPYLGTTIILFATVLILISYHFVARRRAGRTVPHVMRKKVIRELHKAAEGSKDPVIEAINTLASEASKDLKKPPEVVTHRECSIVAQKVSREEIKEEIMELIRDYELSKFAGKSINKDLRSLALRVMNAIKGV